MINQEDFYNKVCQLFEFIKKKDINVEVYTQYTGISPLNKNTVTKFWKGNKAIERRLWDIDELKLFVKTYDIFGSYVVSADKWYEIVQLYEIMCESVTLLLDSIEKESKYEN